MDTHFAVYLGALALLVTVYAGVFLGNAISAAIGL